MAKIIRLTKEHIDLCYEQISAEASKRLPDGVIKFQRSFDVKDRKATVYFTPKAWIKMTLLLDQFDKEVGWFGVASRIGEDAEDKYLISDIVVYPQKVTATTVDMAEPPEMDAWRREHIEDERYDHLYMQGHSHVRMATSPSGTDLEHQHEILRQLHEDGFYIFMIYNKRLERTIRIYDCRKNIQFENADISVSFLEEGEDLMEFVRDAKKTVKDSVAYAPVYKTPTYQSPPKQQEKAAEKPASQVAVIPTTKNASPSKPVQGMGWKGSGNGRGFYDYDDEKDEFWDPEMGWVSGAAYRRLLGAGYYD